MKQIVFLIVCLLVCVAGHAQAPSDSTASAPERRPSAWTLISPLGLRDPAPIDTLLYNYQRRSIPALVSDAYASTGNLGNAGRNEIYMLRKPASPFFFADALEAWLPAQQTFYNVYVPFTQLSFNTGGNKQNTQDRLQATFAGNANRRVGVGAMLDYLYSKGMYQNQSSKDFTFGVSGYYSGDRYQLQAFYHHYNLLNKENGGITDPLYITDPAVLQGGVDKIEARSIPVNLADAHSRLRGQHLLINQTYNVGYWREQAVNDTLTREVYVPVTRFVWTTDFRAQTHKFVDSSPADNADFWANTYFNPSSTGDAAYYSDFSNTLGVSMIEGFRPWARFSLAAYATFTLRHYSLSTLHADGSESILPPGESELPLSPLPENMPMQNKVNQGLLWVGAQLNRQRGRFINYGVNFRMGLTGDVAADIELDGHASGKFRMLGDTVRLTVDAAFNNRSQSWIMQHFVSNHFVWNNDFGKTRTLRVGGSLHIPWTHTTLSAHVENVQNLVYFGADAMPVQHSGSAQVFSARLTQLLRIGILHWDNTLTYQASSRSEVIPLPQFTVYSNLYLLFRAFHVLDVQVGLDCDWYTRYYAPAYQPATMAFCNQQDTKIGNYPLMNVYATCRLKKVRFYVMLSHVNQNLFSREAFSMPLYPLTPRRFQIGLSVDFAN